MRIPVAEPEIGEEEMRLVTKAVESGWVSSQGEFIEKFEELFARFCDCKYGVATSNGTTALHLALVALGVGPKDEVIVPTLTFVATANAVRFCGARPIFADSTWEYWCINPESIEQAISPQTKGIIVVHLYGHPCDMDAIKEIAEQHDLFLLEDCAESHGAEYKGRKTGSFGDISCFSFYGNKIITTGEGGMCLTQNVDLFDKMRVFRTHGMDSKRKYWHEVIGFNYRMTNLQAALGVAQLTRIEQFIDKKRRIASEYKKNLNQLDGIELAPEMHWAKNVFWMYSILVTNDFRISRNKLMENLAADGIDTRPFFHPIHTLPPYLNHENFPVSERLSSMGLNLPSGTKLSLDTVKYIAEKITEYSK